jgi:hypothetical protein
MVQVRIVSEATIGADPALVYALLADYRNHHHRFLPQAFSDFTVERGGVGEGTVISFAVTLAGRTSHTRQEVHEPQPGRVLEETDGRVTTRFTVEPAVQGSRVRIETAYEAPGVRGLIERLAVPPLLAPLYREELRLLDRYAREQAGHATPAGPTSPA